ncbi:MAG: bifunctional hydroxymethylpyrimidine kinase/phosphomethylpyrimidine kinase [Deltaproteobacteria bacterium]|nr:bifunctional hydroxymethylpyrimidine kinase/phosphomethylpyrimidine kinase [Deltaproteobacteria bacterium]
MKATERRHALREKVNRFGTCRVTVVGDPVLDGYLYGTTHRISREAPVLIVREDARDYRLGGAANTAANLAALGVKTRLVGLIGNDAEGRQLSAMASALGIETEGLAPRCQGQTIVKTRILAGGLNTRKQQMLRIDREGEERLDARDAALLRAQLDAIPTTDHGIIISDYGAGHDTSIYAEFAEARRRAGQIVVVDSRYALSAYRRVTAVTPNEPEVEASLGVELKSEADALRAAARLTETLELDVTLVTRGREGMVAVTREGNSVSFAAHGGGEAVDVTGAGDTVAATFTAALVAGCDIFDAVWLANCAGSIVVQSIGTVTCSPADLERAIKAASPDLDERFGGQMQEMHGANETHGAHETHEGQE